MISDESPDLSWFRLAADLFKLTGQSYLVDYYSKYYEIVLLPDKAADSVLLR